MTRMLSLARLLPTAGLALLCLMLVLGDARAQANTPAAPTIDSVTPGDTQLKVAWSAPAGETGITAYDVRHIETSEDETDDTKWTVADDAWTSGVLGYTITGLDNGIQYDVQVRAVNSNGDGTWSGTEVWTPALPAPTSSSVRADDRAVLVAWGEPTGIATGVRAYDVRYIETSADESVDSNWTVEEDAWEDGGGSLTYAITGLTNGTGYDVQVRAEDEGDVNGAWSLTTSATPEDHGDNRTDATRITADARIWGAIDPTDDEDYFRFSVSGTADFWIYTLGDLDTVGELLDSNGIPIASGDYGAVLPNPDNFFLWLKLQSGTYYIKVTGFGSTDEPYVLRIRQFTDTTSRSNAATLSINGFASATIDPEDDEDYFKLQLSEATEVAIRASGFPDTVGQLQNSRGAVIASNDDGYLPGGRRNFLIRQRLRAGTYYVKVSSFHERSDGPYTVYATAIAEPGGTIADAQALTLGDAAGGIIDPAGDEDYFSLTLDETTYVMIGGVSQVIDISGELLDSNNFRAPIDSIHFGDSFVFQGRLDAGTYYLKVAGREGTETGRYTVRAIREGGYTHFINLCSNISRSSGIYDPLYGCQWHLNNDDQFRNSAGQDIRVEEVWPTYTGDGINVAVVDDGMHYSHEDLTDNVLTSFNHNYNPDQTDIYNYFEDHGTAVAGLIAAKDNSLGMRGVAPDAKIYGYNYLVEQSDANEADAMSLNAETTAISNNSWGPGDSGRPERATELWEAAVKNGVTTGYGGKGVFYVWAAGNGAEADDHSNLDEYANFYAVTAVCAVGHDDKRSSYSEPGSNLWVCGPSSSGRVGQPRIATTDNGNRYRGSFGGTSAATPIVSGVAALVREANNTLTWRDVKLILAASARKNDPDNTGWVEGAFQYGSTTDRYNFNHEYGFGMVDAKAAVDLAPGWTRVPELREITSESAVINLAIPDAPSFGQSTIVSASLTIDSYVEFIEFVEVNTDFSHRNFRDLTVELVSPSGAVSVLTTSADVNVGLTSSFRLGSARHLGENAAGEWTLRIKDDQRGSTGRLKSWGLTVYGHGSIPGAPDLDSVTPGGGALTIDWKEPTDTGKTAITSYDLRYIRKDATDKRDENWTLITDVGTPGNLSHTVTGLEGRVKYEFQIRAKNASGHGPWSQAEAEEPISVAPSAPSITNITRGDRTLAVVWSVPSDTGGAPITAYDVRYIETSADETVESNWTVRDNAWRSGDLGYAIRSLTNATEYDVQVRAVNRAGDGHWSDTETGTPLPDDIPIILQWDDTTQDVQEDVGSVVLRAVFTTTLNAPPAADFTFDVTLTTTDIETTRNEDYTPPPSSATFVASDFSQTDVNGQQRYRATRDFTVAIIDDTTDESVENFRVTINYQTPGLPHLQGGPQSAIVTIRDNEHVPVTISWDQSDITVDEDDGSVILRAFAVTTVDKRPEDGFSFDASIYTSNGSAAQPGDYMQVVDTVTFSRNDFSRVTVNGDRRYRASKQIVVNIEDDTIDEIEEDFTVTFEYSNPLQPHLQGGPAFASVKIADNEYVPVTISWEETEISVGEDAGSLTLYARSTTTEAGTPLSDFSFDVRVTTRSGSARQNSDYTSLDSTETFLYSDFSPTFVNGEQRYRAEKQITIAIQDDIYDEGDEVFTVILAYSNPRLPYLQGSSATATITITDDEGVKPTISTRSPPSTYRENGTSAIYTFRASDRQGSPITWTLDGTDRGDFTITRDSSGRGVLAFSTPPDFEAPADDGRDNEYELTVIATDEDGDADRLSFTITVTDLNEGPEIIRVGSAPRRVPENQDQIQVLARYTATDPENPTAPISRWSTSGTDGGDFVIDEQGELRFKNTPDFERPADGNRDNVYVFTVRAYDGSVYGTFEEMVTVTPVNEPPTITTTSSSATGLRQAENRTTRLYTYRATDQEGSTITWSVGGTDGRFFTIDERGQFSFSETNPPDYEIPGDSGGDNVYNVTVQARDDGFNTGTLNVVVAVTDVNEGPEISGQRSLTFTENLATDRFLATYTATDPEDPSAVITRWSLSGTDAGDFTINENGEVTFRNVPDHEKPADSNRDNVYNFSVRASDGSVYGYLPVTITVEDVNEPPTITTTSKTTFSHREKSGATIYTFRATDPEGSRITWSLTGADGGLFAIYAGIVTFKNFPDYENPGDSDRNNEYLLTVLARDDAFNTSSLPIAVTMTDVNEGPEVTGTTSLSFTENQLTDRVLATYTGRDPENPFADITRWSLSGTDARDFTINENGELTFRSVPDHERPADSNRDNEYNFSVRASDGSLYGYLSVTVTIDDVNEPPTVTITSKTDFTYRENGTATIYTLKASDPEREAIYWSTSGADGSDFGISENGALTFASPPDYENLQGSGPNGEYEVTVQARDDAFNTSSLPVTVTVVDVNEGPEVTGTTSLTFTENVETDRVLATYTGRDPEDPSANITRWSLSGTDAGDFTINENGELTFRNVPDHERPADSNRDNVYNLSVRASDGSLYGYLPVTVTVENVNEPPIITTTSKTAFSYRENGTATIYTFKASDPEKGTINWMVTGTDGDNFTISETGAPTFANPPNFESPQGSGLENNQYLVTIQVRDDAFNTSSLPITVTVTEVNEGPEVTGSVSLTFTENVETDRILSTYNGRDPEDPFADITLWSLSGTDAGDFTINENGELYFRNMPDHERPADSGRDNVYNFSVRASDGSLYGYLSVTVTVTDVNEAPAITTTSKTDFTYRENGTATIYTFKATDPEGAGIEWLTAGADGGDFTISETGVLTFTNPPNFESPQGSGLDNNQYLINIQARDYAFNTSSLSITVTVTDVNEGPEVTGREVLTFTENVETDRVLATYNAIDPEDPFADITRWSLSGTDASDFTINENGELTFRNVPDHERPADSNRDNVYNFSVRASDGSLYGYLSVTVTVDDVNESPTITTSKTSFIYRENGTPTIYTFKAQDPERGIIYWSASGADGSDFAISETGALTFTNPPNFESPQGSSLDNNQYLVTVQVRDDNFNTSSLDVTVTVTDLNEGPEVSGQQTLSFTENQATDRVLATYTGSDPENPFTPITRWSLSGTDAGDFTINENSELTFRNVPDYEKPADSGRDNVYNLYVRASDGSLYGYLPVTVTVEDVNEPPTITTTSKTDFTYRENGTATIYTFKASDPERGIIYWSASGADGSDFAISETGALTFTNPPNFESPQGSGLDNNQYLVTVQARDDNFNSSSLPITVSVTNVNEGPEVSGTTSLSFTENQLTDRVLATYTGRDPEDPSADITRWSPSGTDAGDFTINENGELTFRNVPDYEKPADSGRDNVYNFSVRASDGSLYGYLPVTVTVENVNEPPTITTTSKTSFTYRENGTANLFTFKATDPERGMIEWSTSGADGSDFTISETGALTFTNPPNFESPQGSGLDNNQYLVTVQARDDNFNSSSLPITVSVTDVNEGPEVTGTTSLSFTENQLTDRVLATYTGRDPEDPSADITRWSLSGTDAGDFTINENGDLSFRNIPDHERPADSNRDNVYNLSVRASDGRNYGYLEVTVGVEDVNEAPTINTTSKKAFTYRENGTATIYTFKATDPERGNIEWSTSGADGSDFTIEDGVLKFTNPPDFESSQGSGLDSNQYLVTVQARDDAFNSSSLPVTVTMTDVNEGPEVTGSVSLTFTENQPTDRVLATYNAIDPEDPFADITRWSPSGTDAGDFTIDENGQLSFRYVPDHERPADSGRDNVYNFSVRASDGSLYGYLGVTVHVLDVNEAPTITTTSKKAFTYRENGTATIYTFKATDPERGNIEWSTSGADGSDFTIEDGVLKFTNPPDFESSQGSGLDSNQYLVTVRARDDAFNSSSLPITVTVTDVNEGPEVTGHQSLTFAENQLTDRVLATYTAADPEDSFTPITRWSLSGTDAGDFTINENGELSFRYVPDHERPADSNRDNEYLVTVRTSDGRYYGMLDVTVTVTNVNEPPITTTSKTDFTYRENGTATIYTFKATDPEQGTIEWLTAGADRSDFAISETGTLTFASPPDYEIPQGSGPNGEYEVTVQARDDAFNIASLDVVVTVTDVDEGPEVTGREALTFTENVETDQVLATYNATDPEEPFTPITRWSLTGTDAGDFTINENGELSFRTVPDHEKPADSNRDNVYNFSVRASDGSLYGYLEVTVTVEEVNEPPTITTTSKTDFTYTENGSATIYTFKASDPEKGTIEWSVTGTDGDDFTISETGVLSFTSPPDFENPADSDGNNKYLVTVEARDDDFNRAFFEVTITVINLTD